MFLFKLRRSRRKSLCSIITMKVCFLVFILFSVLLTGIESEQCHSKFRMKPTCVTTYGISMPDILKRSKTDCALNCANIPTCQSFFYFHGTRICRQNSEKLTNFTDACSDLQMYVEKGYRVCSSAVDPPPITTITPTSTLTTFSAYIPTTAPTAPTKPHTMTTTPSNSLPQDWQYMYYPYFFMSYPCITNVECEHLINSECRVGICECISGYSFDWTSQSCVPSCGNYGHSYQIEYDVSLTGFDNAEFPNISEEQCLQKCTDTLTFTCRSAEYNIETMTCRLSNETSLTKPTAVKLLLLNNLYHRDCLFL